MFAQIFISITRSTAASLLRQTVTHRSIGFRSGARALHVLAGNTRGLNVAVVQLGYGGGCRRVAQGAASVRTWSVSEGGRRCAGGERRGANAGAGAGRWRLANPHTHLFIIGTRWWPELTHLSPQHPYIYTPGTITQESNIAPIVSIFRVSQSVRGRRLRGPTRQEFLVLFF